MQWGVCLMQKESMKHVHQTLEVKTKKVVRTCCNETDITREWRYLCGRSNAHDNSLEP